MKRIFIACLMALCLSTYAMGKNKTINIRVIETSDVHGSFFPYDFINRKPKAGTLARVSSYVNSLRKDYGNNVVLLDNGDILQGQPTCYYYNYIATQERNVAADIINYMKYDAESVGNHDVETGHAVYDKWIKEINCPMLGCNIIDTKTQKPYVKPYTILNKDGVKIAIIGMLTPAIPSWLSKNLWSELYFEDMVVSARKWVKTVQDTEHPDIIIGLFHSGKDNGIKTDEYEENASHRVAKEVPGFDLILFGHDHTRSNETIQNVAGKPVVCLDPANNAITVADAEITVTLNKKGKMIDKKVVGKLVDMINQPVDEAYMAYFKDHIDKVNTFVNREIGSFKNTIYTRDSYFGSSAFTDLILNLQLQITGADVAFNAPLAFDASIKAGTLHVSDMFNLYRFENQLYVMRLTGEEIRKHLEMSYDQWVNTMKSPNDHLLLLADTKGDQQRLGFKNFTFNFDSAAGIIYEVDVTKPDGQKVRIISMADGRPFKENEWYKVAINSYRGNGGGELLTRGAGIPRDSLESRIVWRSEKDQRYYLMKEIEKTKVMDPKPNNNWKFIPEAWTREAAKRDSMLLFGRAQDPKDIK
ncbi:bifunctional UDP-sugar hydrolase/5'-nucleotidase [Prevotella sp. S7 MS 2]|uniref:bifunctional metallophosphatase/5'-nucleotidase n=1 Tax=Prevotella sp. S7 MS 2 TaxID=1287488 RepID=UPI000513A728|nr:5'-nucleotidase C-terminal domain-containing protein [Prevotella sp. S7 MS 2]KGI61462.1 2', 3'-cyclic nucleotide 2'-phosphodiesterase [Prevotella sp. S7 MS 2]